MDINIFFQIAILIVSVMAHEVAHGAMAYAFGDSTAKYQGRLTLNPLKHIDWFGSVLVPFILIATNAGFVFGWAKPVPYNPYNLRNRRVGEFMVSIAGIATNFLIAVAFAIILRFGLAFGLSVETVSLIGYIIMINLVLAVFNLVPIPPLDGSKILMSFIPYRYERFMQSIEKYGFIVLIAFILFFSSIVGVVVGWLFKLLV
ncbi:MAG: site-2 protease family protein [bacterium]